MLKILRGGLVPLVTLTLASSATVARAEKITLHDAIRIALDHHPQVLGARADATAAQARIGRARAAWLPRISASGTLSGDYTDPVDVTSSMPGFDAAASYQVGLTATQLITDSGLTGTLVDQARGAAHQSKLHTGVIELDLEAQATSAYLDVLSGQELLAVSDNAITLVQEQLARSDALFKATIRPELDVLSAKTQLSQAKLQRRTDRNSLDGAVVGLAAAIGDRPRQLEVVPIAIRALPEEPRPIDELVAQAVAHRAELGGLRDAIAIAEAKVRAASKRRSPVVTLQAGVNGNGSHSQAVPDAAQSWIPGVSVFGALSIQWDLYIGSADTYERADAEAQLVSARAALANEEQQIRLTVSQARFAVDAARDSLALVIEWRGQAERQLTLARNRYNTGVGNFVEFNDARQGLVSAQRQEVQARYALAQARVALAHELGQRAGKLATASE
jgi:outer membrane protein